MSNTKRKNTYKGNTFTLRIPKRLRDELVEFSEYAGIPQNTFILNSLASTIKKCKGV